MRCAASYGDYFDVGGGPKNLLAFGVFDEDPAGTPPLLRRGRLAAGSAAVRDGGREGDRRGRHRVVVFRPERTESVGRDHDARLPEVRRLLLAEVAALRGQGLRGGPLARMAVNGDYPAGRVSVMDRHAARAEEALKIASALDGWLAQLSP